MLLGPISLSFLKDRPEVITLAVLAVAQPKETETHYLYIAPLELGLSKCSLSLQDYVQLQSQHAYELL